MHIFFSVAALLIILINIYDGFKMKRCFGDNKKSYFFIALPIHIILLGTFFAMFFMRGSDFSDIITDILNIIGFGFVTASFYMFLLFIICDIIRFISSKFILRSVERFFSRIYARGITVVIISFLFIVYGVYNASDIIVTEYDVDISKGSIDGLNIVMFSDTHIGTAIKEKQIDEIVEKVNNMNPDIICLCGDIFDEGTSQRLEEYAAAAFSKFQSKYGAYYITGNHEYYSGDSQKAIKFIQDAGINVLEDECTLIDNRFYIIGRMDKEVVRETGNERKEVSEIMKDINKELPVILLDHRPVGIIDSKNSGVDLQLSGHTHAGQIFPINFLVGVSNDLSYGYLKDENFNIIVTSGCGTWGVPIRIGSSTEIVNIKIN